MLKLGNCIFGIASARNQGANPVADFGHANAFADRNDGARHFKPRNVARARWWRVESFALNNVGAVYASKRNFYKNLAR